MPGPDRVPSLARPFVAFLVAAMCASALFVWEPWPFTSFRLFSHLRTDEQMAWQATTLDADGTEREFAIDSLDQGYRHFGFRMAEFTAAGEERRDELCRVWVRAANEPAGRDAVAVRLYLRRWRLSERKDDRARPGTRELEYTCTAQGLAR